MEEEQKTYLKVIYRDIYVFNVTFTHTNKANVKNNFVVNR